MKIVNPNVEYWKQDNPFSHIAKCARVCYASDRSTNNIKLCNNLWNNKHYSMFRHSGVYYIIPEKIQINPKAYIGAVVKFIGHNTYVSTNEQCAKEYWDKKYNKYRVLLNDVITNKIFVKHKMIRYTICVDTSIDITRELNRKSPNSIAEQSTRYVDFIKKVGIRFKRCHWMTSCNFYRTILYKGMLKCSEWFYKIARSKHGLNLKPQDARFILPLNTMSKAVYTYTVKEWEEIINMRLWDYTGPAHPDAKIVAQMIYDELIKLGYDIKNYKNEEQHSSTFI